MEDIRCEDFSDGYASSDAYDREELEVALYSQIHFEENTEFTENFNEDCVNNNYTQYVIDVQGNERKGFIANKTSADLILNEAIDKKYENTLHPIDSYTKRKCLVVAKRSRKDNDNVQSRSNKLTHQLKRGGETSNRTQQLEKSGESLANKEVKQSSEMKTILRNTPKSKGKLVRSTAEHLILGSESDSGDVVDDPEVEIMYISSTNSSVVAVDSVSVGEQSDSDADSLDIVLGDSDNEENDIQINVECPSPRYTYKKLSGEEPVVGDLDHHSDDGEDWVINKDDSLKGSSRVQARYYKPIRCHNCNQVGHLSKNCPQPNKVVICAMCAEPGHICRSCPQAICYNCDEPGHDRRNCRAPRRSLYFVCYRCNMPGHDQRQCPENWRQYHVTVTPGKVQPFLTQRKRKRTSCYNCGDEGHIGHECEEERMNKFMRVSSPFISRYQSVPESKNKVRKYGDTEEWSSKRLKSDDKSTKEETSAKEKRMKITFDTKTAERNFDGRNPAQPETGNKVRFLDQKQKRKHEGRIFGSREPAQLETGNNIRRFLEQKQERMHAGQNCDSREPAQLETGNNVRRFQNQKHERKHAGRTFDSTKPSTLGTGNEDTQFVDQKQDRKQSSLMFADTCKLKKNSNEKTSRKDFDKQQFASFDKKKQTSVLNTENFSKMKPRHRKKKDKTVHLSDSQTLGTHNTVSNGEQIGKRKPRNRKKDKTVHLSDSQTLGTHNTVSNGEQISKRKPRNRKKKDKTVHLSDSQTLGTHNTVSNGEQISKRKPRNRKKKDKTVHLSDSQTLCTHNTVSNGEQISKKKSRNRKKKDKTVHLSDSQVLGTHNTNRVVWTDSRLLKEGQSKKATKSKTAEEICNVIVTLNSAGTDRTTRTSTPENITKTENRKEKEK